LDDEHVSAGRALVEAGLDLVGSLAVDTAVTELEPRLDLGGPVLPLARLVAALA
jgi:hypothetical protein